ncbi:17145_t:CDS:2 [Cetraspora pellucida]|uniref:17145_t:CDS:1 n=1 Tax=Cetraspora pellucida TaxID=1433469 RepID=A0ACA9LPS0_9GLOM|nr:17145_t:CDS:2 [Cetraspora pellucida]
MKKLSLSDAQITAKKRNGKCLSTQYINAKSPLEWKCKKGYTWSASLNRIKDYGKWCPHCAGNIRLTLKEAIIIAEDRGGKCLSNQYINIITPLLWQCNKSHIWYASLGNIKNRNTWCPQCAKCGFKLNLGELQKTAYLRGGKCLSKNYTKSKNQYYWKCDKGHTWYTSFNKNRKPDFLKTFESPQGLQLDIFYPEYGFAIEVQGEQHEKYIKFFHKGDPNNFIRQQERDQLKKELCEEN